MGWHNESYRHALASHGIRTKAIKNPISDISFRSYRKGEHRDYKGSGLEGINEKDVIDVVESIVSEANKRLEVPMDIKRIWLMGSRVEGYWKPESDLDVYLQLKRKRQKGFTKDWFKIHSYSFKNAMRDVINEMYGGRPTVMDDDGNEIEVQMVDNDIEPPRGGRFYNLMLWEAS